MLVQEGESKLHQESKHYFPYAGESSEERTIYDDPDHEDIEMLEEGDFYADDIAPWSHGLEANGPN